MADSGGRDTFTSGDALAVVRGRDDPHLPLTASEVADALDRARRTAYNKLTALAEREDLRTKKIGARLSEDSDRRYYLCPDREVSAFSPLAR